ncbi:MAG: hypothetical protein ACRD3D_01100 [Terriglobia bacterium]
MIIVKLPSIREALKPVRFLGSAFLFCVLAQAADVISSLHARGTGKGGNGIVEDNPFARHADGSFWLAHALDDKLVAVLVMAVLAMALYLALRRINVKAAKIAGALPFLYLAVVASMAVMSNLLLLSGLGRF